MTKLDKKTRLFEANRRTLEGIAYRMLGSLADASDVVQDCYLKWKAAELGNIQNARAWLITVCSRTALNVLQSARKRRENYVGLWLPEPFLPPDEHDVGAQMERDESVSLALLLALEKLSPVERAVFLLHDVFDFRFEEIASILEKSSANCRQLATRARKRMHAEKPRFVASTEEHRRLLKGFLEAAREGKIHQFKDLLANSVALYADGGGRAEAVPDVLLGAETVGRFFMGIWQQYAQDGVEIKTVPQWFNGSPGILIFENDRLATAITLDIDAGRIQGIYAIRNPDKLALFGT